MGSGWSLRAVASFVTAACIALTGFVVLVSPAPAGASSPPTPWDGAIRSTARSRTRAWARRDPIRARIPTACASTRRTRTSPSSGSSTSCSTSRPALRRPCPSASTSRRTTGAARSCRTALPPCTSSKATTSSTRPPETAASGSPTSRSTVRPSTPRRCPASRPATAGTSVPGPAGSSRTTTCPPIPSARPRPSSTRSHRRRRRPACVPDAGAVDHRRLGPVALGLREDAVRSELGPPDAVKRGFLRYCVTGGGAFLVGQPGDRSGTFGTGGMR